MKKEFYDDQYYLTWVRFDSETIEDDHIAHSAHSKLDKWSGYLYQNPNYINNLFMDNFSDKSSLFYCYDSEEVKAKNFIGIAIITPPIRKGNMATIDYIVVDPRKHNKGLATRMLSSITHNPEFFVRKNHSAGYQAIINSNNTPAIMASIKSDEFNIEPHNNPIVESIRREKSADNNGTNSTNEPTHYRIFTNDGR